MRRVNQKEEITKTNRSFFQKAALFLPAFLFFGFFACILLQYE